MQSEEEIKEKNKKAVVQHTVETYLDTVNDSGSVLPEDYYKIDGKMGKELQAVAEKYFSEEHDQETQTRINRFLNNKELIKDTSLVYSNWGHETFKGLTALFKSVWEKTSSEQQAVGFRDLAQKL